MEKRERTEEVRKKLEIETNHNTSTCEECNALIKMALSFISNNEGVNVRYVSLKKDEFHSAEITELL